MSDFLKLVRVLFLGAGKRLSLLEKFLAAAEAEKVGIALWAMEDTALVPIAGVASVITGPKFKSPEFESTLLEIVRRHGIHLVVPNMDAATVGLSRCGKILGQESCHALVSSYDLCRVMEDKGLAAQWFEEHQIPAPRGQGFPRIAKARLGFGSRDQIIAESAIDLEWFFSKHQQGDYLVQEFVRGQEYTVDAYVDRDGRLIGALSRKRLAVSAGEVDHSETHRHEPILQLTTRILAVPGWEGPITLQFIEGPDGPVVIEVNPRFGGGVTHSIHCGLDMPRWAIRELLGRSVDPFDKWENGSIMTRCRRDVFLRS